MQRRIPIALVAAFFASATMLPMTARPQTGGPAQPAQLVTLTQAIAIAAEQSPVLSIARDDYRLAQINVRAAGTPLASNISANASSTDSDQASFGSTRGSALNLQIEQLIYDGGRVLAQIRAARSSEDAAFGTYKRSAQQLSFNVAQAYYSSLEANATVELDEQIVKQSNVQEALIRAQMQAGTASRVDLETSHVPTVGAQLALTLAIHQAVAAQAAFDTTLGLHANAGVEPIDDASIDPEKTRIPNEPTDYDKAIARALLLRPDYLSSQDAITAAQQTLRAARLGHAPSLTAQASAGLASSLTSATGQTIGTSLAGNNSIGVTLAIPIYDQGATNVLVAESAVLLHQAQATSSQAELTVESDVRQALSTLQGTQQALKISETQMSLAQEVLSDTQEQYRGGYTVLPLLLNAQTQLTGAEDQRLTAIYSLRQAEQNYLLALGDI